jgi:hypothetical protein
MAKTKIDSANARRLAVKADVHPDTITKMVRGGTVRGMSGERARKALTEAGYLDARKDDDE